MSHITILLVDDNPTFLRILAQFIEEDGRNEMAVICQAGGGYEALSAAEKLRPQVVLIDLEMPDLHGLVLIPRLRKILPEAGLIVLSMLDTEGYREAAFSVGADGFVSKAAMLSELVPAIHRLVHGRESQEKE